VRVDAIPRTANLALAGVDYVSPFGKRFRLVTARRGSWPTRTCSPS